MEPKSLKKAKLEAYPILANLVLVFVSIGFCLALFEIFLRFTHLYGARVPFTEPEENIIFERPGVGFSTP